MNLLVKTISNNKFSNNFYLVSSMVLECEVLEVNDKISSTITVAYFLNNSYINTHMCVRLHTQILELDQYDFSTYCFWTSFYPPSCHSSLDYAVDAVVSFSLWGIAFLVISFVYLQV